MSEFTVTDRELKTSAGEVNHIRQCLKNIQSQMENVAGSDILSGEASLSAVANYLLQISKDIENSTVSLSNVQTALQEIARLYEETERRIAGSDLSDISLSEAASSSETSPSSETPSFWERIQQGIKDLEKLVRELLKGAQDKLCMFAGDPVNMSTGNFFLQTRDLMVKGFMPIIWERSYNGQEHDLSVLGEGWRHSHLWRISHTDSGWNMTEPDGRVLFFEENGEGEFEAMSGEPCRLRKEEDRYEVIRDRMTLLFDTDGRILEQKQIPGGRIFYRYDQNRLTALENEHGSFLRFRYDRAGLLTDITASDGGWVHYEYSAGRLIKARSVGTCTEYEYDEAGYLEKITGVDGKSQLHNIYDIQGRVKEQQLAGREKLTYEYLKDRTVLTWPDGTAVTYIFDSAFRHIRTLYHDSEESCTYNSRNRKTSFTDRLGRMTRYGYDSRGNLTSVVDPAGNRTSMTYNSRDRVTAIKRPDGGRTVWHYTVDGLVSEKVNAEGGLTKYNYNEQRLPSRVCFPDGTQLNMAYDAQGNMIACDADGVRVISAEYDEANRRILERNGEGAAWSYTYDKAGRIICVTNPKGNRKWYEYDANGRVRKLTDYAGNVSTCTYNDSGEPECRTDVCGNITSYVYDERRRLKEKHIPGGCVFAYEYDADNRLCRVLRDGIMYREYEYDTVGNRICERDSLGNEVRYTYDVCDRVVRISRADGAVRSFVYDACGRVLRETDYQGAETLYEYDLEGNLTARTDPTGGRAEWHYNVGGLADRITEATGREIRIEYGSCGRIRSVDVAGGGSEEYAYDACGRIVKERFADGYEKSYTYDCCGNLTEIRDGVGRSQIAEYDAMGRVTQVTDLHGNKFSYTYRPDGIMTGILDPAGSSTCYQYNPQGHLEKVVRRGLSFNVDSGKMEEQEQTVLYERDHLGRLLSETDPLGHKTSYTYDAVDRVIGRTDRMGRQTVVEYDLAGNMCGLNFADGGFVQLDYTSGRQMAGMEDASGRTQIVRDIAGRTIQLTGFDEMQTLFSYTDKGQIAEISYPDMVGVQYRYDRYGRPAQMCCGSLALSFAYDEAGRLMSRTDEKGSGTAWEYGPAGRIVKISCLQDGDIWKTCSYVYDECGNKTEVNWDYPGMPEQGSHYSYVYDMLNRIREVYEEGDCIRRYSYDGFGNRIRLEEKGASTEYQYDRANRLVFSRHQNAGEEVWKKTEYRYDPEGNQIHVCGPDGGWETEYDCQNHPVATDTDTKSVRRLYNGLGHLLATTQWNRRSVSEKDFIESADISQEYYLNDYGVSGDGNNLLAVRQSDGTLMKYLQDPFGMRVARIGADGNVRLLLTDELGTVNAVTGEDGRAVEAERYDEFGKLQTVSVDEHFGFAGLMRDPVESMYNAGVRQYDPLIGRFTGEDPMMRETCRVQDQNLYTYCFNQPMTLVDRNGCFPSFSDIYQGIQDFGNGVQEIWNTGVSVVQETWNNGVSVVQDVWNWGVEKAQYVAEQAQLLYRIYTDPEFHYSRNQYNEIPSDLTTVYGYDEKGQPIGQNGWEKLPDEDNRCHVNENGEQGAEAAYNKKFVKKNPDGSSSEVIICFPNGGKPYLVDDYLNGGTYNFHNPGGWLDGNIPHLFYDLIPYLLYGNQKEDGGLRKCVEDGLDFVRKYLSPGRNLQMMCS